jgi:LacI family transcriptional regulator
MSGESIGGPGQPGAPGTGGNGGGTSTISDIARLSGVSNRTVSRVINRSPKVGKATRARVQEVIDQLSYRPNAQARSLAGGRSYLLGLIYDNPDAALFIDEAQRGVLSGCRELGYELVIHPCGEGDTLSGEVVGSVKRSRLDGVIVLPPLSEDHVLAGALAQEGVPYVRLAAIALDTSDRVVVSNERSAVAVMAEYLVKLGHRRIGYVTGPEGRRSTRERLEGFGDALARLGAPLREDLVVRGSYSFESGIACARQLLGHAEPPTAIFASNDDMAAGVIHRATEMGLNVPRDLSVAGFDDSALATRVRPALTTMRRPVRAMARLAAHKLIASIEGRLDEARVGVFMDPDLIVRDSTRPLEAAARPAEGGAFVQP